MHISIHDFRNISTLSYEIDEGRVNFLYGVSGSGKSTIVRALSQDIDQTIDVTVGSPDGTVAGVEVDDKPGPVSSVSVFSDERQKVLFSAQPDGSFYDVFIGNEGELRLLQNQYRSALSELNAKTSDLLNLKASAISLIKVLGKTNKDGHFTGATKMGKALNAYDCAGEATRAYVRRRGMGVSEWLRKGFSLDHSYDEGVCPFCEQDMESSEFKAELDELKMLSVKDLRPLFDSPELLRGMGRRPIDISTEAGKRDAETLVSSLPFVDSEVDKIIGYCRMGSSYQATKGASVDALEPNPVIYDYMPDLKGIIEGINERAKDIKTLLGRMKAAFDAMVRERPKKLNSKLAEFGVPYRFEVVSADCDEKTASYKLVHIDANNSVDMRGSLSFGERNLITLLLFLQDNTHDVMLIDDPASSFDDFRRTQILKTIMSVSGNTLLIVSHDQAFVRRAVRYRERGNSRIGRIDMLCNDRGTACVKPLDRSSFGYFADFIKERACGVTGYYQTMLNIRLLCDIHLGTISEETWGYVSAILHGESRQSVLGLLENRGKTEAEVIEELKGIVGKGLEDVLVPIPNSIDYSTAAFSLFERLIAARESIDKYVGAANDTLPRKLATEMLNDLVHMNDAMMACINPYRYPVWASSINILVE